MYFRCSGSLPSFLLVSRSCLHG
ncbi:hypothetical protein ID866_10466 [Astraeus odoratus]|nr:hypothetical protein ID866_10466 [Astraeus odoratus]